MLTIVFELHFSLQSHISESEGEMKLVEKLFPTYQNYTELYDKNNLLTNKVECFYRILRYVIGDDAFGGVSSRQSPGSLMAAAAATLHCSN